MIDDAAYRRAAVRRMLAGLAIGMTPVAETVLPGAISNALAATRAFAGSGRMEFDPRPASVAVALLNREYYETRIGSAEEAAARRRETVARAVLAVADFAASRWNPSYDSGGKSCVSFGLSAILACAPNIAAQNAIVESFGCSSPGDTFHHSTFVDVVRADVEADHE